MPGACALEKAAQGGAGITASVSVPKSRGCDLRIWFRGEHNGVALTVRLHGPRGLFQH